ncbi:hypothetical protein V491_07848 [Pseudogymnoascus sp. VKM F-3775]|nr:hypothetical protein V491_07848 [Pseudogymnoascus sp. VKM F-3775]
MPFPVSVTVNTTEDLEIVSEFPYIRADEQEHNEEQTDYEAEVTARLEAMTPADYEAAEVLKALQSIPSEGPKNVETSSQHSDYDVLPYDEFDSGNQGDNATPPAVHTKNPETVQRSPQNRTPSGKRSPLSQSSGNTSRRGPSFPVQKNTLLSWMNHSVNASPASQPPSTSPTVAVPSPSLQPREAPSPIKAEFPIVPAECPIGEMPEPTPRVSSDVRSPAPPANQIPGERTAFKLAKQLRGFQGCTHAQHHEADQKHEEHHQRPDVHSECSSISEVTSLIRGSRGAPLPDVSTTLMKAVDYRGADCQAAFEGTNPQASPEESPIRNDGLPQNLCLSKHHNTSRKNRQPKITFDIDSTCCFPTSLAVARCGINWYPKAHPFLNLTADIHFGLKVSGYTSQGRSSQRYAPLHKIPHYCLGTFISMDELLMFVFFPSLHEASDYEHSTYLSKHDQELWLDAIVIPSIYKVVDSSNILGHYPASSRIADLDSMAVSAEGLAVKESAREQLLKHAIQPQYLDPLWTLIPETIDENPGFDRFRGATLFMHSKNTKLEFMGAGIGLAEMYDKWQRRWNDATDDQFYNKDRAFVDLAKQTTSSDTALPYDKIPDDREAEVYLWKTCCLEAYRRTRTTLNTDGSQTKGNLRCTTYPWATMRDTMSLTMFTTPQGKEARDGLIYSQFYRLIKTPFDSTKVYVFDNDSVENLALDPGYIRSLRQEGGGITFSKGVCEFSYMHSKKRAHANLVDNQWKSYGTREEHRISITMLEEIYQQWVQWDLYDADDGTNDRPLPYYIVPTSELLDFLYAQINKYCFLFEHILAHTAKTYSLPETVVMVVALRALRFCYGSSLLGRESLLYKDRWEVRRGQKVIVKEGLGMHESMERCGFGWFLPKFNWSTWRLAAPHGENVLVGNLLMHEEYKRRWRAVKDLRDVFIRFNQAVAWYGQYSMDGNARLQGVWLEYLHVLNLEQFDTDIWKTMLKANRRCPELRPEVIQKRMAGQFCYRDMKKMFQVDGQASPPHVVTGNKMRFEGVKDLVHFLFMWDDGKERRGWESKPYRVIFQKSFEMIERRLGYSRAEKWLEEFFYLVRLTHWVLPYPSNTSLITLTKTSRSQGLRGRTMWFSAVYADPRHVQLPLRSAPSTLGNILREAEMKVLAEGRGQGGWRTSELMAAYKCRGVECDYKAEHWVAGKKGVGYKGFIPLWERGGPGELEMLEQIRDKSLEELEGLMAMLS